ncbi:hypothetical protein LMH87_002155 [Akanthomyces muscarius]|uniref:Uncharacterized protein n=1 Tax=Akanthomyces muscarius TaxID=2231603 RepID=A0A9W8Q698_AKAMU|nr:hypothetical protein LMH87_002155 [Akanthomyces muscarius]KAJ4147644.1 hypothetical protein LMH87_002155 [Akanthomyces muscarius]
MTPLLSWVPIHSPASAAAGSMSRSDSATPAAESCGVNVGDFISNVKPLVDALPANSLQKHTLQLQMAEADRIFNSESQREEEVRCVLLDRIFDPECSFTAHHAAKFARLLDRPVCYATTRPDGRGVSPALILHLAAVVRSEPLQDAVADPVSQSWLFSQWCILYSSLEAPEAVNMLESGMLRQLYGIDLLRMTEHKRQLLDRTDNVRDIFIWTRNALSGMPRLLYLCDILRPGERNAPAITKVLDSLDAMAGPLGRALTARFSGMSVAAAGSAAEEQAGPDSKYVSIKTAFELAKESGSFLPFCESMRAFLVQASAENDASATVAVGVQVNMMLAYIKARELARLQPNMGSPAGRPVSRRGSKRPRTGN